MRQMETQCSIAKWADEALGPVSDPVYVAARANEEMAELLWALVDGRELGEVGGEIADVIIVLSRLATMLDLRIDEAVDAKMSINRARRWRTNGRGDGRRAS